MQRILSSNINMIKDLTASETCLEQSGHPLMEEREPHFSECRENQHIQRKTTQFFIYQTRYECHHALKHVFPAANMCITMRLLEWTQRSEIHITFRIKTIDCGLAVQKLRNLKNYKRWLNCICLLPSWINCLSSNIIHSFCQWKGPFSLCFSQHTFKSKEWDLIFTTWESRKQLLQLGPQNTQ